MNLPQAKNLLIAWNDDYALGIPIIDEQHRGIVSVINTLFFFMRHNHGAEAMRPVILMIEQHLKLHSLTEESLLERAKYPGLHEHIMIHDDFDTKLSSVSRRSNRTGNPEELLQYLKSWWLSHVCVDDRLFKDHLIDYLNRQGDEQ
jgi:hemerythrin-like metal-binding domain